MSDDGSRWAREFLEGRRRAVERVERWIRLSASSFRRRLGDDWEDAVQEALVEVTRDLRDGRVRDLGRLRPYVWRVAANTCLDRVRRRSRWVWVDAEEVDLPSSQGSVLSDLLERGAVLSLLELASRCPESCRRLWEMILEGLSYREMSARTGLAEGTLRVRVLRCRRHARQLAEAAEPEGDATNVGPGRPTGQRGESS